MPHDTVTYPRFPNQTVVTDSVNLIDKNQSPVRFRTYATS